MTTDFTAQTLNAADAATMAGVTADCAAIHAELAADAILLGAQAIQERRERKQTAADGTLTWTYPQAFGAGVVPVVEAVAEAGVGVTDVINVQLDGTPTATSAAIRVTRTQRSVVALIGLTILSVPTSPGATWVHLRAMAP